MKHLIDVQIEHKKRDFALKDDKIFLDSIEIAWHTPELTSPIRIALYNQAIEQLDKISAERLAKLDFESLVHESKRLEMIRTTLKRLRCITLGNSRLKEKMIEQLNCVVNRCYYFENHYEKMESFSWPERIVLFHASNGKLGSMLCDWDMPYCPIQDKIDNRLACQMQNFKFEKYLELEEVIKIKDDFNLMDKKHQKNIEQFRQFKTIAGNDIVNWGTHKLHAVAKKYNLEVNGFITDWTRKVSEYLISKGISPKPDKIVKSTLLKKRYFNGESLSQLEYVSLFKTMTYSQAARILPAIDLDHAVGLLAIKTKNVRSKLATEYNSFTDITFEIIDRIEEDGTAEHFQILKDFCFETKMANFTNGLLKKFVDYYTAEELNTWCLQLNGYSLYRMNDTEIDFDKAFYDKIASKLPEETRFKLCYKITKCLIQFMSIQEREEFILACRVVPEVLARFGKPTHYALVDWDDVKQFFLDIDPDKLRDAVKNTDWEEIFFPVHF